MKKFMLGRKNIGELDGKVFSKEVLDSKHLFRVLDAYGIDSQTLNGLPAGTTIEIHEQESGKLYRTTKEEYLEHGEYYHFKQPREDHRTQLFLRRKYFEVVVPKKLEGDELARYEYMKMNGL